jgi:hypothetical protein
VGGAAGRAGPPAVELGNQTGPGSRHACDVANGRYGPFGTSRAGDNRFAGADRATVGRTAARSLHVALGLPLSQGTFLPGKGRAKCQIKRNFIFWLPSNRSTGKGPGNRACQGVCPTRQCKASAGRVLTGQDVCALPGNAKHPRGGS